MENGLEERFHVRYTYSGQMELSSFLRGYYFQRLNKAHRINLEVAQKIKVNLPSELEYCLDFNEKSQLGCAIVSPKRGLNIQDSAKYIIPRSIIGSDECLTGCFAHENTHLKFSYNRFSWLDFPKVFDHRTKAYSKLGIRLRKKGNPLGIYLSSMGKFRKILYSLKECIIDLYAIKKGYWKQLVYLETSWDEWEKQHK